MTSQINIKYCKENNDTALKLWNRFSEAWLGIRKPYKMESFLSFSTCFLKIRILMKKYKSNMSSLTLNDLELILPKYHVCVDGNSLLPTLSIAFPSNVHLFPFSNTTLEISNLRLNINWITLVGLHFIKKWVKCFSLTYIYVFFMYISMNTVNSSNFEI